jgi:hypothetical protein
MILNRKSNGNIVGTLYDSSNILASSYDKITNDLIITFTRVHNTDIKTSVVLTTLDLNWLRVKKIFNTHIKQHTTQKLPNIDISVLTEGE